VLRIDPAAAPLWRTPDSLQFGHDPVLALLEAVPPGADEVIHALTLGTDERGLAAIAESSGFDDLDLLLARLAPVLVDGVLEPPPPTVAVDGAPDLAALVRPWFAEDADRPDLAIVVAHHLVAPADTVRRLAEDVPHLAVVFDDQAAVVGPFVVPGRTPCLRCAEEHRLDDPARRAIAAQLLRRGPARSARSLRTRLAAFAALAEALDALRVGGATGLEGAALRIGTDGAISRERRPWHARCSCRSADGPAPTDPAPPGTWSASAPPAAAPPTAPTTAAAGPSPG
jgi:bacteriocin biosynthesis cyclodehydratase domain-containing protein